MSEETKEETMEADPVTLATELLAKFTQEQFAVFYTRLEQSRRQQQSEAADSATAPPATMPSTQFIHPRTEKAHSDNSESDESPPSSPKASPITSLLLPAPIRGNLSQPAVTLTLETLSHLIHSPGGNPRMEKIKPFDPDTTDALDWLGTFELAAETLKDDATRNRQFLLNLAGRATHFNTEGHRRLRTFQELKTQFIETYAFGYEEKQRQKLATPYMGLGDIRKFIDQFEASFSKVYPALTSSRDKEMRYKLAELMPRKANFHILSAKTYQEAKEFTLRYYEYKQEESSAQSRVDHKVHKVNAIVAPIHVTASGVVPVDTQATLMERLAKIEAILSRRPGGDKVCQGLCYNCGKPGHIARRCTLPRKPRTDQGNVSTPGQDQTMGEKDAH